MIQWALLAALCFVFFLLGVWCGGRLALRRLARSLVADLRVITASDHPGAVAERMLYDVSAWLGE